MVKRRRKEKILPDVIQYLQKDLPHQMFVVYLKKEVNKDQITEILVLRGILIWNTEDVRSKYFEYII